MQTVGLFRAWSTWLEMAYESRTTRDTVMSAAALWSRAERHVGAQVMREIAGVLEHWNDTVRVCL